MQNDTKKPPNAGKGRAKGVANRVTQQGREAFRLVVEAKIPNIQRALTRLERKKPAEFVRLVIAMAEFCFPKMHRIEHSGLDGGPIEYRDVNAITDQQLADFIARAIDGQESSDGDSAAAPSSSSVN